MNKKPLTDEALRDDLYCELMFMAGALAYYGVNGEIVRDTVEKQIDMLMPVVKRHIKRHKRSMRENS